MPVFFVAADVVSSPSAMAESEGSTAWSLGRAVRPHGGAWKARLAVVSFPCSSSWSRGGHGACELCGSPVRAGSTWKGARQVWPRLASLSAQVAGARAFKVFLGKAPSCSRRDNECASLRRSCKDLEMVIWRQRQVGRGSHYSYFTKRNHDKVTDGNGNKLHQWRHHIQISWF